MPLTAVKTRKSAGTKKVVIAKWTIILFIAAENDLAEDMKDIYDQIAKVGSNPGEVNFIVIFDGLDLRRGPGRAGMVAASSVSRQLVVMEIVVMAIMVMLLFMKLRDTVILQM